MQNILWKCFDFSGNGEDLLELFRGEPYLFFLDSSQYEPNRGRYSFIGFDPFEVFIHTGPQTLELLKRKFDLHRQSQQKLSVGTFSPLMAGIVGCLSYDFGLHLEKIRRVLPDDLGLPDAYFGFYYRILTIDHFTQKLYITSSGLPEKEGTARASCAVHRLASLARKIENYLNQRAALPTEAALKIPEATAAFKCNFRKEQYIRAINKALEYIGLGDIYQVNLSQRFQYQTDGPSFDPLQLYQILRQLSPSPFGGYLDGGEFQLISNSPERFLRLDNGRVQTRPMKGTRPRGKNAKADQGLRDEIVHSAKEKAELLMITDLLRNDLGRVCDYGSVRVSEMRTIEEYLYVFQATSTVEGTLNREKDCFDLIKACFPGGSITGCPKIRAMQIIEELEPTRRGMYTGSMGYINFDGNMDLNILIRTALYRCGQLFVQVGGGIVADSLPEKEYDETLVKARSVGGALQALLDHQGATRTAG